MKQLLLIIITFLMIKGFGQPLVFLHGNLSDSDWESLKIDFENKIFYYNYAGHKEAIKLIFLEFSENATGEKSYKVRIPNISKIYIISGRISDNIEELIILEMRSTDGTYQKDFKFVGEKTELNGKSIIRNDLKLMNIFMKWLDMNPDYCKEKDCSMEKVAAGSSCQIAVVKNTIKYEYGDINKDGVIDALVTFELLQCDGGNALMCYSESQVILLSQSLDYKVIDSEHLFRESNDCIETLTNINPDGTINGIDFCLNPNNMERCPSIEKKRIYELDGSVLVRIKK